MPEGDASSCGRRSHRAQYVSRYLVLRSCRQFALGFHSLRPQSITCTDNACRWGLGAIRAGYGSSLSRNSTNETVIQARQRADCECKRRSQRGALSSSSIPDRQYTVCHRGISEGCVHDRHTLLAVLLKVLGCVGTRSRIAAYPVRPQRCRVPSARA